MRKSFIYGITFTAALLSSCKGDYDDWAAPQGFDEEEAKNISVNITPAAAIEMENVTTETIQLFTASVEAPEGMEVTAYEAILSKKDENGDAQGKTVLKADASGNVLTKELVSAVEGYYGKNPVPRKLVMTVMAYLKQAEQAFCVSSNQEEMQVTLVTPDISQAYYLIGDVVGGWEESNMIKFDHSDVNVYDDPVFTITITTTADDQYWKIIPQKNIDGGDLWANPGAVGTKVDGDDSMSGLLVNENAGAGKIAKAGKYNMTINMMNYTYEITKAPTELYMTGSEYSWGGVWKQLTPVNGTEADYWMIVYLGAGEKIKFAPQPDWGNDFGGQATLNDEAGAGLAADSDNNLEVKNAGWYLLHVVNGAERIINVLTPNVYLIGETSPAGWNVDETGKFAVPETKDGEFVSPAFVASNEVRMCVSLGSYDWWKAEFIVLDGKIVYRGNGGDQERVSVSVGQKAYLNFTEGIGSFR